MAAETISVWKRHPQWQLEVDRWRELAEAPLDRMQLRLQLESAEATIEALKSAAQPSPSRITLVSSALTDELAAPSREPIPVAAGRRP